MQPFPFCNSHLLFFIVFFYSKSLDKEGAFSVYWKKKRKNGFFLPENSDFFCFCDFYQEGWGLLFFLQTRPALCNFSARQTDWFRTLALMTFGTFLL